MQLYPRILVNVLVILVNILVNLLVKLAKLRVRGAMGLRGIHLGEARTQKYQRIPWSGMDSKTIANETTMGLLLGILLELLGILLGISPDVLGFI